MTFTPPQSPQAAAHFNSSDSDASGFFSRWGLTRDDVSDLFGKDIGELIDLASQVTTAEAFVFSKEVFRLAALLTTGLEFVPPLPSVGEGIIHCYDITTGAGQGVTMAHMEIDGIHFMEAFFEGHTEPVVGICCGDIWFRASQDDATNQCHNIMSKTLWAHHLVNSAHVETERRVSKERHKVAGKVVKEKQPYSYSYIDLGNQAARNTLNGTTSETVVRDGVRFHHVREHLRVYPSGKIALVHAHFRGNPNKGVVTRVTKVTNTEKDDEASQRA